MGGAHVSLDALGGREFAARLRQLRHHADLTVENVARGLFWSPSKIISIEMAA